MEIGKKITIYTEEEKQEIILKYAFDAPVNKVFNAFTQENMAKKWLVPESLAIEFDTFLMETNGKYKYTIIDKNNEQHTFFGVVHEVSFPYRIIQTFEYETKPKNGKVSLEVLSFKPLADNKTQLTHQTVFRTVAERDEVFITKKSKGVLSEEKKLGIAEAYNRLDSILTQ